MIILLVDLRAKSTALSGFFEDSDALKPAVCNITSAEETVLFILSLSFQDECFTLGFIKNDDFFEI